MRRLDSSSAAYGEIVFQLAWLAVRRCGRLAAIDLVAHHVAEDATADFDAFAARNGPLLDKRLLSRFYRSSTLAAASARTGWVEPDLAPFPWPVES